MAEIVDASQLGSPGWWLVRLNKQLIARRPTVERAAEYYDGAHNLQFASKKFLEAFGGLFRAFADNWCGVVVDAAEERLNVEGFRVASTDVLADDAAWGIWQDNQMDAQSQMGHQEAITCGAAYGVVWYGDKDGDTEITIESPLNTIVACHPKFRNERLAGTRIWRDDFGFDHAELWLPDALYLFRTANKAADDDQSLNENQQWTVDPDAGSNGYQVDVNGSVNNPLSEVPIVEILNNPRLHTARKVGWAAHSELRPIMPLQDALNKMIADLMTTSEMAAFPQRYALGYEEPRDPNTGQKLEPPFARDNGAGKFWWLEDANAKFGQFDAADLKNFVVAVDMLIQHVASISRTPPHYLNASADRLSGESIKAAETGLVAKVHRKQRYFGEAWEEIMRLAGAVSGNQTLAAATRMETIWRDPETRTESEHVDAVTKEVSIGLPWEAAMEELGKTPEEIKRLKAMRAQDAFLNVTLGQPMPMPAAGPDVPGTAASAVPGADVPAA